MRMRKHPDVLLLDQPATGQRWGSVSDPIFSCGGAAAMSDYICPYCGADDSTRCAFLISGKTGTVVKRFQDRAREVRCRVMHYTDERISAPKDLR